MEALTDNSGFLVGFEGPQGRIRGTPTLTRGRRRDPAAVPVGQRQRWGSRGGRGGHPQHPPYPQTPPYPTDTPYTPRNIQLLGDSPTVPNPWGSWRRCRVFGGALGVSVLTQMKGRTAAQGNQPVSPLTTFLPCRRSPTWRSIPYMAVGTTPHFGVRPDTAIKDLSP